MSHHRGRRFTARLALAGVLVGALAVPAAAPAAAPKKHDAAGPALYENCFWTGPRGLGFSGGAREANQYPDADATYWFAKFVLPAGAHVEVKGTYPHARYMSFNAYNAAGQPTDATHDAALTPDAGSKNPFRMGARRTGTRNRSYTMRILPVAPPAKPSDRARNTLYAAAGQQALTVVYRVYANDRGTDVAGDVPLPSYAVVRADGSRVAGAAACPLVNTPDHDVQVSTPITVAQWKDLMSTPGLDQDTGIATDKPAFRRFFSAVFNIFGDFRPETRTTLSPPDPGGLYSNVDNRYLYAHFNRRIKPVVVLTGKAPTVPQTYRGERTMTDGQVRYWSICSNDGPVSGKAVACASDYDIPLRGKRQYTIVISRPADRPRNATARCGVLWLDWGTRGDAVADPDYNLVIIRHMLAKPGFDHAVQAIKTYGTERKVMGAYYPTPRYTTKAAFDRGSCRR